MRLVKIYGERNTNTNYLGELVKLNLDAELLPGVVPRRMRTAQTRLPAKDLLRDIYFRLTFSQNLGWKHSMVASPEVLNRCKVVRDNPVVFLTISKNPYSWLLSLYRRPYHQYYKVKPDFESFLEMPWSTQTRENLKGPIANPVELWNLKNGSYAQLSELQCMNLTTEEIFLDAEEVVRRIGGRFDIDFKTESFVNFDESTKYESKDSDYYRDYYLNESWKTELSSEAIAIVNNHLDKDLMTHFGYKLL